MYYSRKRTNFFLMPRLGIALTGFPGSGSTTLGKNIARALNLPPPYYAGGVVRWLCGEIAVRGIGAVINASPDEILQAIECGKISERKDIAIEYSEFPEELDRLVDEVQYKLLEEKEAGVHEGRITPHLAHRLKQEGRAGDKIFIKICCTVDPREGAKRQRKRKENHGKDIALIIEETIRRLCVEQERYRLLYNIKDPLHERHFDIVINTTALSEEETTLQALRKIEELHPGLLAHFVKEK